MTIYRGPGGAGNANSDSEISVLTALSEAAVEAADEATQAATDASASALSASTSASAAAASAGSASTSATNAASSASAASTSASSASSSATAAASSASSAAASASSASTNAGNAADSATAAASSASSASSSASSASTSAANASSSASSASTSATLASNSASSAAASATAAANSFDSFDDRYLGAKTFDPTVDNDGNALLTGALYFNSSSNVMKVWTGSAWSVAYISGSDYLPLAGGTLTGALGVNGVSPAASLDVNGSAIIGSNSIGTGVTLFRRSFTPSSNQILSGLRFAATPDGSTMSTAASINGFAAEAWTGSSTASYLTFNTNASGAVGATERMRLDSSGNLGVGTSSPSFRLDVSGTARVTGAVTLDAGTANGVAYLNGSKVLTSGSALTFDGTTLAARTGVNGVNFGVSGVTRGLRVETDATSAAIRGVDQTLVASYQPLTIGGTYLRFDADGVTEGMRLTSTGLGIGTSSPGTKLDVVGAIRSSNSGSVNLFLLDGSLRSSIQQNSANLYFNVNDDSASHGTFFWRSSNALTTRMTLDTSGNLGLGRTPSAWGSGIKSMQIGPYTALTDNQGGYTWLSNNAFYDTSWKYVTTNRALYYAQDTGDGGHKWFNAASGTAGAAISFTQAMTLTASNELLVNRTSASGLGKLNVDGGADFTGGNVLLCRDSGNVGVGTSSPTRKLSVAGTSNALMDFNATSFRRYSVGSDGNGFILYDDTAAAYRWAMDASGNFGIGTINPTSRLHVASGNIRLDSTRRLEWGGTNNFIFGDSASNYVAISTNGSERLRVDDRGNLGLVVTPSAWGSEHAAFQIGFSGAIASYKAGTTAEYMHIISNAYNDNANWRYIRDGAATRYEQFEGAHRWFSSSSGTTGNAITFTQAMTLDASGNLMVGTTSALAKFDVRGTGRVINAFSTGASDQSTYGIYVGKFSNDSTTSQRFIGFSINNDSAGSGQINANGASQAAFGSFSDARLKENIVDLGPQLEKVMALRPVEFDYKDGSGHQTGFIAQEMQQVYPDAVGEQDGFLTITGYGKTEARLIKAIQELKAELDSVKSELATLKGN